MKQLMSKSHGAANGETRRYSGEGSTASGGTPGKESDRNWQESAPEVLHAPAPARGAADLKAPPHAADPNRRTRISIIK